MPMLKQDQRALPMRKHIHAEMTLLRSQGMPLLTQDQRALPMRKHIHCQTGSRQRKKDNRAMPLRKQEVGAVTTAKTVAAEMIRMRPMPM